MPNPLFPTSAQPDPASDFQPASPFAQPGSANTPVNPQPTPASDPAVEMIRNKIRDLYDEKPAVATTPVAVAQPQQQAAAPAQPALGSIHQQYMQQLSSSGKTLVEIQTAWHDYYVNLPDDQKYQVWQEFYVKNGSNNPAVPAAQPTAPVAAVAAPAPTPAIPLPKPQVIPAFAEVRDRQIARAGAALDSAASRVRGAAAQATQGFTVGKFNPPAANTANETKTSKPKLGAKHHIQSMLFGLGVGAVVVTIFLFSFFNERIIAPLIQPSRQVNNTPVIVDVASTVVAGGPKVLIPKINVEIPVDYSQTTTDEKQIELALDKGIVHYPTTVKPGQTGNAAFFGHSSNNIFNPGKYKFAFVLLHELVEGDTFYLTNDGKTYAYKVFSKRIVQPSEVSVLGPVAGHASTATLITCDPPGTSINRLIVVGDQISPDAAGNPVIDTPAVESASTTKSNGLPGNGPSLWSRIWASIF